MVILERCAIFPRRCELKNVLQIIILLFVTGLMMLISSCDHKPESKGNLDEIIVFADSLEWVDYKDALGSHFSKIYRMPTMEREYVMTRKPIEKLHLFQNRRNVLFLGTLNGQGEVSQQIRGILSENVVEGINNGDYFYIPREDEWASDQYVVYLVAPNKDAMLTRIYDLGELVYDNFKASYYKRLKKDMYSWGEQKEVERFLFDNYPFTLRIQHDYHLVDQSIEENYVWLRRFSPDRSMFIHWIPYEDSVKISFDWIVAERNRLAEKIYEGDIVVENETGMEQVQFNNSPALRLEGTWKNPKHFIGGPFRNTTFIDKENKLIYMVDFYVQAVGKRKKPFLDQLDVMAHTFRTRKLDENGKQSL